MGKSEADYLEELIAFRSVSADKKASKECAEFCAGFFEGLGLYTKLIESDGYPNVVATTTKTKRPKVLLQCHMDVVPAESGLFKMKRDDGKLMGRGTFDMKFACASYMKLVERLGKDINKYDFGIMLTFDEEIGGHHGVEALLDKGYSADVCILPDSGKNWQLESSAHGAWFLELSKEGRNAHASLPEQGVNAAQILIDTINDIKKFCGKYSKSDLAVSLTRINSGEAMNQIPGYAEAVLDIRFRNANIQTSLRDKIERICESREVDFHTKVLASCMSVEANLPEINEFIEIAGQVLGRRISKGHSLGTTDARYFCAKEIPCIVIQPDGGGRHGDDEWVDQKGVESLTEIIHKYIEACAII